jgi:hypothetical protein
MRGAHTGLVQSEGGDEVFCMVPGVEWMALQN